MKEAIRTIKYLIRSNPRLAKIAIALDICVGALSAVFVFLLLSLTSLPTYATVLLGIVIVLAIFALAYLYLANRFAGRLGFDDDIADQLGEG